MIAPQYINDLLMQCQNELSNLNAQVNKGTDKALNKEYLKHIQSIQKITLALQQYKNLDPPEEAAKKKW